MSHKIRHLISLALSFGVAAGLTSCGDSSVTAPPAAPRTAAPSSSLLGGLLGGLWGTPKLIECPSTETLQTSAVIDAAGGTLSLGGTRIVLPAYAVLSPTTVELTIPASRYMEVELTANGGQHFLFERAIFVTVDYSRCGDEADKPLSVWYIDSDTKALLQRMLSLDNKFGRSITFVTGHFSGYALAN